MKVTLVAAGVCLAGALAFPVAASAVAAAAEQAPVTVGFTDGGAGWSQDYVAAGWYHPEWGPGWNDGYPAPGWAPPRGWAPPVDWIPPQGWYPPAGYVLPPTWFGPCHGPLSDLFHPLRCW